MCFNYVLLCGIWTMHYNDDNDDDEDNGVNEDNVNKGN